METCMRGIIMTVNLQINYLIPQLLQLINLSSSSTYSTFHNWQEFDITIQIKTYLVFL